MQVVLGSSRLHVVCFTGPFGVGKTTALRVVSDRPVIGSDVTGTGTLPRGTDGKTTTTVGIEMGEWTAPDGDVVRVVGTPGQARFDDVRRDTLRNADAVVLWVFGDQHDAADTCVEWLQQLTRDVTPEDLTVAVTRLSPKADLAGLRAVVADVAPGVPVMQADPRVRTDVIRTLTVATFLPHTERTSA